MWTFSYQYAIIALSKAQITVISIILAKYHPSMITLKDIRDKLLTGDFSSLLHPNADKTIHPTEVASIFNSLPFNVALDSFQALPPKKQVVVFEYLDLHLQR